MAARLARWPLMLVALTPLVLLGILALANTVVGAPTAYQESFLFQRPPPPSEEPVKLRIVTFNVASGYLFTSNRPERMMAIGKMLTQLDPDIVGFQETFVASDRRVLLDSLEASRLRHHTRFPGAVVGNGLLIVSAFPIEEAWFHRFQNGGAWWRLWEGDWWAGKGVGLARLRLPGGLWVDFYNTHAQASRGNPENEKVRLEQMAELAHFVRASRLPGAATFVVGDLNTQPGASDYQLLVKEARLERAMDGPSGVDHMFWVRDSNYLVEVLDTRELSGLTWAPRPELFLGRAPHLSELIGQYLGPSGQTRLSDHPGYLAAVEIRPLIAHPIPTLEQRQKSR